MSDTDIDNMFKVTSMIGEVEMMIGVMEGYITPLVSLTLSEPVFKSKNSELEHEIFGLKQQIDELKLQLGNFPNRMFKPEH